MDFFSKTCKKGLKEKQKTSPSNVNIRNSLGTKFWAFGPN